MPTYRTILQTPKIRTLDRRLRSHKNFLNSRRHDMDDT